MKTTRELKGFTKGLLGILAVFACSVFAASTVCADTGVYVGKEASADGTAIIGVANDNGPGVLAYAGTVEAGELTQGDVIEQTNGFVFVLPGDSVKYNYYKTMDYGVDEADLYSFPVDACATNEFGVSVNAVANALANPAAIEADPYVEDGIGEESIPQILASTSTSAKEAVELLTGLVDEFGVEWGSIVLISDQNETWYVEIYTGHQYAAKKLADDVVTVFGDEFILKTVNPEEKNVIISPDLYKLAEDNGFVVYNEDESIDLISTYSGEDVAYDESHMRTWVGHEILAPSQSMPYSIDSDIPDFYVPDEKVSLQDVFALFRNRYEGTPYCPETTGDYIYRCISDQVNDGVYVIQTYSDVPSQAGVVTWATPANAAFSPFIPMINAVDKIPEGYETNEDEDGYNSDVAQMVFANLNVKCFPHRNAYGDAVRTTWEIFENEKISQYEQLVYDLADMYAISPEIVTREANLYSEDSFDEALDVCEDFIESLEWSMIRKGIPSKAYSDEEMIESGLGYDFYVNFSEYAEEMGWAIENDDDEVIATKDGKTIIFSEESQCATLLGFGEEELTELGIEEASYDEGLEVNLEDEEAVELDDEEDAESEEVEELEVDEAEENIVDEILEEKRDLGKVDDFEEEQTEEQTEEVPVSPYDFGMGMILTLDSYYAAALEEIPQIGMSRDEAIRALSDVTNESVAIVEDYFGKNINEIDYIDAALFAYDTEGQAELEADLQSEVIKLQNALYATGNDLAVALTQYYETELAGYVDELSKNVSYEEIAEMYSELAYDSTGLIQTYVYDTIASVVGTQIDEEEIYEILNELSVNASNLIEKYFGFSLNDVRIDVDVDLDEIERELGFTDEDVVDVLSNLDPEVIDGLSELFGVDVEAAIDEFVVEYYLAKAEYGFGNSGLVTETKAAEEYEASAPEEKVTVEEVEIELDDVEEAEADADEEEEEEEEEEDDDYEVNEEVIALLEQALDGSDDLAFAEIDDVELIEDDEEIEEIEEIEAVEEPETVEESVTVPMKLILSDKELYGSILWVKLFK